MSLVPTDSRHAVYQYTLPDLIYLDNSQTYAEPGHHNLKAVQQTDTGAASVILSQVLLVQAALNKSLHTSTTHISHCTRRLHK